MIRHYFLAIFFTLIGFVSSAQYNVTSKYFVYLQTEPAQPFFIRINNQQLSANASGYLILPQLKDGDYKLVVGFPMNKYPEQTYNFTIDSKDKGYLIKDFGGAEGWGLFDLQTMAVQKPLAANAIAANKPVAPQQQTVPKEDVSDFTKVLSKAANDPGLLEKPKEEPKPVVVETPKPVIEAPKEEPKPVIVQTPKPVTEAPKEEAVVAVQPKEKPVEETVSSAPQEVTKPVEATVPQVAPSNSLTSAKNTTGGVIVTYDNVNENGIADPVTIFIPEPKIVVAQKQPEPEVKPVAEPQAHPEVAKEPVKQTEAQAATQEKAEQPAEQKKGVQSKVRNIFKVQEKPAMHEDGAEQVAVAEKVKPAGNCKRVADESDFLKLRRQMAQKDNDEGMIGQAKSAFKSRCYTTAQIKYLSSMFLSNAGKYNFYEAAYPHIADSENFSSLESEIQDQFYKDKFNTLIGK